MPKKSIFDKPYRHVKYTKYGFPYVDPDELHNGELSKELYELHERMKSAREKKIAQQHQAIKIANESS